MAAPTLKARYGMTAESNASPLTVTGVAVAPGDWVVVVALTSDSLRVINAAPTWTGGNAFGLSASAANVVDYANAYLWTAQATTTSTQTISLSPSAGNAGANFVVVRVFVFSAAYGLGGVHAARGSGLPSGTIPQAYTDSMIVYTVVDWNAVAATSGAFTSNGGAGAPQLDLRLGTGAAGYYSAWYPTPGAPGTKTLGMSAPSGQKWSSVGIEVFGYQPQTLSGALVMDGPGVFILGGFRTTSTGLILPATTSAAFGGIRQQQAALAMGGQAGASFGGQAIRTSPLIVAGVGGKLITGSSQISSGLVTAAAAGKIISNATVIRPSTLVVAGAASASVGAVRTQVATLGVTAGGTLLVAYTGIVPSSWGASGTSSLVVAGRALPSAAWVADAPGALTLAGMQLRPGSIILAGTSSAKFTAQMSAALASAGVGRLTLGPTHTVPSAITMAGRGLFVVSGRVIADYHPNVGGLVLVLSPSSLADLLVVPQTLRLTDSGRRLARLTSTGRSNANPLSNGRGNVVLQSVGARAVILE